MEPRAGAEEALTSRFRLRLAAACALLTGIALIQSPGLVVADTKLDLAVAPARFLMRAGHLWDQLGAFGQLQNQAYGYLWPMGPFFLGGTATGLPEWVVQRLWLALVMCVALVGAARLARELGVRSDLACLAGGLAFALSPRMLSTLGATSIESWPSALAPWVLLPLAIGSTRGSPRRAAAWSAVAVAMVGGVNAAAAFAVIPLGVVWLLTRSRGRRRTSMMLWWPLFTLVGTAWWLVPLFVLGAYSPPFLDFVESASNTTYPTTLYDTLRGTSNWIMYVSSTSRAGNDLLRDPILILNSAVVVVLGLLGMLHRRNPERLFLVLSLLLGMLMVTMGHTGAVQGWFADDVQRALDGMLVPLRNVHKFDPIVRLPMVLGLAWTVDRLLALRRRPADPGEDRTAARLRRLNVTVALAMALVAVGGAAIPAAGGRITPSGGFTAIPDHWSEASDWLHDRDATALVLPGTLFGDYEWGYTLDEPIQPLGESPWAVRNAVPLTPAGNIRMLDAVEDQLAQGRGTPALAAYLRRAGVTHVVVRNDVRRTAGAPDPVLVHQALADSPGLSRVTTFGPAYGGAATLESRDDTRVIVNGGWQAEYPAIEVYAVTGDPGAARTSEDAPVVVGGAEDLLTLTELDVLGDEPTRLGTDVPAEDDPGAPVVLTDGLRAVEQVFGRIHDGQSATLAPGDPRRLANPTRDYLPEGADPWVTWARYDGIAGVRASSSRSDANAPGGTQRGLLPFAALDGSPSTHWQASEIGPDAWWAVDLETPVPVTEVRVTAGPLEREVVRLRTDGEVTVPTDIPAGETRTIRLTGDEAGSLRVEDASGRTGRQMSLAEVEVPGVTATRSLALPPVPEAWGSPARIVLQAVSDDRTGCVEVAGSVRCVPGREVAPEEPLGFRRVVTLPEAATYDDVELRVRGRAGADLQALLDEGRDAIATASSAGNPDLRSSALAAVDGDSGTTWSAAIFDVHPELELRWDRPRTVSGLELELLAEAAARLPDRLQVRWPGGSRVVNVDDDGEVSLPAVRTDRLTLTVRSADPAVSVDFAQRGTSLPIGISEVRVDGVPALSRPIDDVGDAGIAAPCGTGPTVTVAGRSFETAVDASAAELYAGDTIEARICGDPTASLPAGTSTVEVQASDLFTPASLVLSDGSTWDTTTTTAPVDRASPVDLTVTPGATGGLLTVHQNDNPGWVATQDGADLEPVVVDGWQQGWRLASGSEVRAHYEPDGVYRAGLLGGAVALLLLVLATLVARRPWRDTDAPQLRASRWPAALVGSLGLVTAGLLAGWAGFGIGLAAILSAAVAGAVAVRVARPVVTGAVAGAVVVAMATAAAAYLVRPWGELEGWAGDLAWPHYLVLAALCLLVGGVLEPGRRRFRSRIAGRSTSR